MYIGYVYEDGISNMPFIFRPTELGRFLNQMRDAKKVVVIDRKKQMVVETKYGKICYCQSKELENQLNHELTEYYAGFSVTEVMTFIEMQNANLEAC